jgi:hypothetical protein
MKPGDTGIWFDKNQFIIAPIIARVIGFPQKYSGARVELATVRRMSAHQAGIDYKEVLTKNVFPARDYLLARQALKRHKKESLKQYRFRLMYWMVGQRSGTKVPLTLQPAGVS